MCERLIKAAFVLSLTASIVSTFLLHGSFAEKGKRKMQAPSCTLFGTQFNHTVRGILSTVAPGSNLGGNPGWSYLQVSVSGSTRKYVTAIYVTAVPISGGSLTDLIIRTGRVLFCTGDVQAPNNSLTLDPFTPLTIPSGVNRRILDQTYFNERNFEFPRPIVVEPGETATVIAGLTVGQADSASAPTDSIVSLTVFGWEDFPGDGTTSRGFVPDLR